MKQIPWDFFAQRRNISYASFKNMSYEQYARWCGRRNVIPLQESEFQTKVEPPTVSPPKATPKALPPNPRNTDPKLLSKKKKSELVELCSVLDLEISGKETKKQLVALLAEQSP